MTKKISVGIADMKIARREGIVITYALGSCIGITFYDPMIKLTALLHIMLPEQSKINDGNVYKFADSGIRETLRKFYAFGGMRGRTVCKIAGGAQMFQMKGGNGLGDIGKRNTQMVKKILAAEGLRIVAEDTGSTYARTMQIDAATGQVIIHSAGRPDRTL
ncbi:MAG: chemotaxis protein CheD [Hespellia sp.]|jgi:chemotaxis protein CheD|nr:chemotaxis protein CheD [Hespellia sp.]